MPVSYGILTCTPSKGLAYLVFMTGNRLKYVDPQGKEHIDFRKAWTGDKLDMIMANFKESIDHKVESVEEAPKSKAKKTEIKEEEDVE